MSDKVNFIRGSKSLISSYQIINGNILIATDTQELFIDCNNVRLSINNLSVLETESEREGVLAPLPLRFYYVIESNKLYTFTSDWILINNSSGSVSVINNLESDSTTDALSAAMGKQLNDTIGDISTVLESLFTVEGGE